MFHLQLSKDFKAQERDIEAAREFRPEGPMITVPSTAWRPGAIDFALIIATASVLALGLACAI